MQLDNYMHVVYLSWKRWICFYCNILYSMQIVFAKGANYAITELAQSEYDVMSLDWDIQPQSAR